jgi:hypothetical protein
MTPYWSKLLASSVLLIIIGVAFIALTGCATLNVDK